MIKLKLNKERGVFMKYKKVVEGLFINRPNRFIALVLIDGIEETVHVRNTGRCRELLTPYAKILLEDCSHNLNRKTRYSIVAVWKEDVLVNIDSQIPNQVVFDAIKGGAIPSFQNISKVKRESSFKNSRFDMSFENGNEKGFIEVKGVTLEKEGVAMFPDAPTTRGTKHVLEMIEAVKEGYTGAIFFLIQMKDTHVFKLNSQMDPKFSEAIKLAYRNNVDIIAYDSIVSTNDIVIGDKIEIDLKL